MNPIRYHIHRHRWWAAALIVAALLAELLVPAGYMPTMTNGTFLMQPCAGQNAPASMMRLADASNSAVHDNHKQDHKNLPDNNDHGKLEMPCVFSSLSAQALGPIDPILLVTTLSFILTTPFIAEQRLVLWRGIHLRPPAQGPPVPA